MSDTTTNKRKCDICKTYANRWDMSSVKKIQYYPGERYYACTSDIRSHTTALANLCPTCMGKFERLIYKHVNKGDV